MTTQDALWIAAALSLLLAAMATLAERRRAKRRNLDNVGWVSWQFVQIAAGFAALGCAVLALKL